jgi:rhodanese-related sulfurtransferase
MGRDNHSISPRDLYERLGSEAAPIVVDIRRDRTLGAERLVAPAFHRSPDRIDEWRELPSDARSSLLRSRRRNQPRRKAYASGIEANFLEGGIAGWTEQGLPTRRNIGPSPSKWVTREHPKIDRIACPWLIRRFIDPNAEFIYVPKDQVVAVAQQTGGFPYDIDGVEFTHEGERCSFDTILRISTSRTRH